MSYEIEVSPPPIGETAGRRGAVRFAVIAAILACGAVAPAVRAEPVLHPNGVTIVDSRDSVLYHGQRYCWYDSAWRGPGWYECGYAWRNGLGWGGGHGWHGWPGHHPWHWHHHHPGHPRPGHPRPGGGNPGPGRPPMGGPGASPGGQPPSGGGGRPR